METFAIIGFIFGLSAMGTAGANAAKIKKLESNLETLGNQFRELENRQEPPNDSD